jgi:hypothetical protein
MTGVITGTAGNLHLGSECTRPDASEVECQGNESHDATEHTQLPATTGGQSGSGRLK